MGKIALFDRDSTFAGAMAMGCKPHGVSICTKRTGLSGKDLVVWNLSQYPCDVVHLLSDLRRAKGAPGLIVVWEGESCKPAGLSALKAGAVAALSKESGDRPIQDAVRRYFASQRRPHGEEALLHDLIDRSYTLSFVNELLEGLNRCNGLDDLGRQVLPPLLEAAGAPRGQLALLDWGSDEPPAFAAECRDELRALAERDGTYHWKLEGREYVATIPLIAHGRPVGEVWLNGPPDGIDRLIDAAPLLSSLCGQVAMAAVNLRYLEDVKQQALRDGLTGLYNHAFFQQRLREEADRARRYQGAFSVILVDVDRFKRVNDEHGHQTGDQVLRLVADALRETLRQSDLAARYGGEEFVALLPETDAEGAVRTAERLREAIRALQINTLDGESIGTVTASFGVACLEDPLESPAKLLQRADQALYRAKNSGRDRVCEAQALGLEPQIPVFDGEQ
ncbi:MAG: diguanylate cyclase, partial [Cyanobacteria bacterium RYN_339]|nr:diguanylate cyclase [Cyanobacteria bacterium RYN_339]